VSCSLVVRDARERPSHRSLAGVFVAFSAFLAAFA
jgi:hypothetical protein